MQQTRPFIVIITCLLLFLISCHQLSGQIRGLPYFHHILDIDQKVSIAFQSGFNLSAKDVPKEVRENFILGTSARFQFNGGFTTSVLGGISTGKNAITHLGLGLDKIIIDGENKRLSLMSSYTFSSGLRHKRDLEDDKSQEFFLGAGFEWEPFELSVIQLWATPRYAMRRSVYLEKSTAQHGYAISLGLTAALPKVGFGLGLNFQSLGEGMIENVALYSGTEVSIGLMGLIMIE